MLPLSSIKHIPTFRRDNTEKNVREMFIMVLFINKYILKEIIEKRFIGIYLIFLKFFQRKWKFLEIKQEYAVH